MGLIFINCEDAYGRKFPLSKCIRYVEEPISKRHKKLTIFFIFEKKKKSLNVVFAFDLIVLILLGYQIFLRIKKTEKCISRKLAIFYLLLIQLLGKPFITWTFRKFSSISVLLRYIINLNHLIANYLLFSSLANSIYSGISPWVEAYLIDIYFREVCFTYILFFFARKAWNLSENDLKKQKLKRW